jgi:proline iminopeptidase
MEEMPFYPEIEPYQTGFLKVSNLHSIYYEQVGIPEGMPILYLHGGPGSGIHPLARQFFDPKFYRVVLLDQRGSGKSTPFAELKENTTWDLVEDIERLRKHLQIERWVVFGGSWGSTLSLAYAVTHPERVMGLILRGIFLCRKSEIDWFYQSGAHNIFPDAWEKFIAPVPLAERGEIVKSYYRMFTGQDEAVRHKAAVAWNVWETTTSRLVPDQAMIEEEEQSTTGLALARIECHYFVNDSFMASDTFLLDKAKTINHIPTRIIQGRYDVVCPIRSAWDLSKVMPSAELLIVPDAGHSAFQPNVARKLVEATNDFKKLYKL